MDYLFGHKKHKSKAQAAPVSILVLMDYLFGLLIVRYSAGSLRVSILVLMDYLFGLVVLNTWLLRKLGLAVSILVLMDYLFGRFASDHCGAVPGQFQSLF